MTTIKLTGLERARINLQGWQTELRIQRYLCGGVRTRTGWRPSREDIRSTERRVCLALDAVWAEQQKAQR